jgi:hypothetical protein
LFNNTPLSALHQLPMPRRSTLAAERVHLLALPGTSEEFIRHYTFSEADLSLIHQCPLPLKEDQSRLEPYRLREIQSAHLAQVSRRNS